MSDERPRPTAYVRLTDPAIEDLHRLASSDPQTVRKVLAKMLMLERDPNAGDPLLGDLIGFRKLTVADRTWRIVWRVTTDANGSEVIEIAEVWAIGARADAEVYAEMTERVAMLDTPITRTLADVLERLGRAAAALTATTEPVYDPVPPWLATRLEHTAGMSGDSIRKLSGAAAMELWERYMTERTLG